MFILQDRNQLMEVITDSLWSSFVIEEETVETLEHFYPKIIQKNYQSYVFIFAKCVLFTVKVFVFVGVVFVVG